MSNYVKSYIAILIHSTIIGFSFYFMRIVMKTTDTVDMLAHRFTITAICILICAIFTKDKVKLEKKNWKEIIPLSLGYPILFFIFQALGILFISTSEAGIIYAMSPIITFIIAKILIDEKATKLQIGFMLLSVLGVVLINVMKGTNLDFSGILGVVLILLSVASFSVYNVSVRKISKKYTTLQITRVTVICGFIFFNIISIFLHIKNGTLSQYFVAFSNRDFVIAILYLGILSSFMTTTLTTYALATLEATTVSMFQNVSTLISIFAGVYLLNETLNMFDYIGIVAVIVGALGFNLSKKYKNKI